MQYKTVPGPYEIVIKGGEDYGNAIRAYASIIDHEAAGGWELAFIQQVPITKDKGCVSGCLASFGIGTRYEYRTFNMLVFQKEGVTKMPTGGFSGGIGAPQPPYGAGPGGYGAAPGGPGMR